MTGLDSRSRLGPIGPSPPGWTRLPRSLPSAVRSAPEQNTPPSPYSTATAASGSASNARKARPGRRPWAGRRRCGGRAGAGKRWSRDLTAPPGRTGQSWPAVVRAGAVRHVLLRREDTHDAQSRFGRRRADAPRSAPAQAGTSGTDGLALLPRSTCAVS